jgi:hypothetical protein
MKFILVRTETLTHLRNIEIQVYFSLKVENHYTVDLEQATIFDTQVEAKSMIDIGQLVDFVITELYDPEPGTK